MCQGREKTREELVSDCTRVLLNLVCKPTWERIFGIKVFDSPLRAAPTTKGLQALSSQSIYPLGGVSLNSLVL